MWVKWVLSFFFQGEDGIRDLVRSRGLGDVYKRQKVDNGNPYWFSYPGYSELFTGYADTSINSNSFPPNPHVTVLEFLNKQPGLKGKVAAFGAWEAFDRILNEERNGIPVKASISKPYSSDENCLHISYEAGKLEDLNVNGVELVEFGMTVSPQQAPDEPEHVTVDFISGVPVSVNGESLSALEIVKKLNRIAGRHGVGRIDMVADPRFADLKARVSNRDELHEILDAEVRRFTVADLVAKLSEAKVPCSRINNMEQVFNHPQALHRGRETAGPACRRARTRRGGGPRGVLLFLPVDLVRKVLGILPVRYRYR